MADAFDDSSFVPDKVAPAQTFNDSSFVPDKAAPAQSESQFYHGLGSDKELEQFPNVQETGGILPIKTTYNPDGTVDSSRADWSMPGKNLAKGIGDLYQQAEDKSTDTTPDSIKAMLNMSMVPGALRSIGNRAGDILSQNSEIPKSIPPSTTESEKNYNYINGINKNLNSMKGVEDYDTGKTLGGYGAIYDKAGDASGGVMVHAPKSQDTVSSLLEDMKGDLAHKTEQGSSQAYRDLEAVNSSFDENGNIPLDKVTLLKRRLNDLYSPDMGDTRGAIYSRLNNQVNNIIKQARVENPEWGALMDSGNGLFNNYKKTADSLSDLWGLSDKKEYEDALKSRQADPTSAPPTAGVRQKIGAISQPGTVQQYEDAMRVLPKEMQDDYTASVIANNPSNSRLLNAAKAVAKASYGNKYGAANSAYKAIIGNAAERIDPSTATAFPHVEDAIDLHTSRASLAHDAWLQKQADAKLANIPPDRLALPSPAIRMPEDQSGLYKKLSSSIDTTGTEFPLVQDKDGNVRHMTQEEAHSYIQAGQHGSDDLPRGLKIAQSERANSIEADRLKNAQKEYRANPANASDLGRDKGSSVMGIGPGRQAVRDRDAQLFDRQKTPTIEQMVTEERHPEDVGDVGEALLHSIKGFSRGGTTPSEWDMHADNMKKLGHTREQIVEHIGARPRGFAKGGAVNTKPSDAQKASGNYKKDHIKLHGLDISIENPKGSNRSGSGGDGKEWKSPPMPAHYGYIRGTVGKDGDHVDCFIGEKSDSKRVYVIDQKNDDGKFDEHKCMLNCSDRDEAVRLYKGSFSDKKNRIMKVTRMSIPDFKDWLKHGNTKKPVAA